MPLGEQAQIPDAAGQPTTTISVNHCREKA
jgi:hypothetical protein